MKAFTIFFSILIWLMLHQTTTANAQSELPALTIETVNGTNKISWICSYSGIKSVMIQRSSDSVLSFSTIGFISKPRKGVQTYTDKRPTLGKNYYRVLVVFKSDIEWFSNTYKVVLDSATIAKSRLAKLNTGSTNATTAKDEDNSNFTDFYYEPSTQVYTNPYTGHINISLADALKKRYSISFFNPEKEEVLKVSRIKKPMVVLDKYNFNARGTYFFQLKDGKLLVETGYVTIY